MKVFSYEQGERLADIIRSKRAANRAKDRESLPRLEAFRDYLRSRRLTALPINPSKP